MNITHTDIWKLSIPMHPFTIATGTMLFAQNIFIRVHVSTGGYGVGECSAFPMIVGETQNTAYEMAKDFAAIWKYKSAADIDTRMQELHDFTAGNSTIKSAFDMALFDLAARSTGQPLYRFFGAQRKAMETDLTIGIGTADAMAVQAAEYAQKGVGIIKIKLGKDPLEDIERVRSIRVAAGDNMLLRVDANQGWNFADAVTALRGIAPFGVQFCEQPMRRFDDHRLRELKKLSPISLMADESVFDHHDAERLIRDEACDYVNIKFAKSSGILEAQRINAVCEKNGMPCMMGGMLESRVALTAFAHFAMAHDNIRFYDMDTCLLGHQEDPVTGGVVYNGFFVEPPDGPGIGADVDESFLQQCEKITV